MSSFISVYLHIVFSTKYRLQLLDAETLSFVFPMFNSVAEKYGVRILKMNGVIDHVHLLLKVPATVLYSEVIKEMKRLTSLSLNRRRGEKYFYWQRHYAAFSISYSNIGKCTDYINNQQIHHLGGVSYADEIYSFSRMMKEEISEDYWE